MAQVLAAIAPPDDDAERRRRARGRHEAAGEQRGDRDAGHRADGDEHDRWRDRLRLRAGRRQQRDEVAGLARRAPSSPGNSTGATAAMSAAFEPEMPETRYIAPIST